MRKEVAVQSTGEIVKLINFHQHAADAAQVEKGETITKLKSRAAEVVEESNQVISECVGYLTQAYQGVMSTHSALHKCVHRKRSHHVLLTLVTQKTL